MSFTIKHSDVRTNQKKYRNATPDNYSSVSTTRDVAEQKLVKGIYDVTLQGGALGVKKLGDTIPAGAIITKCYYEVLTTFVTAGADAGTIALKVGSTDLKAPVAVADATNPWDAGRKDGLQTGTAAAMSKITADSPLTIVFAGQTPSVGKLQVFVEYVI